MNLSETQLLFAASIDGLAVVAVACQSVYRCSPAMAAPAIGGKVQTKVKT